MARIIIIISMKNMTHLGFQYSVFRIMYSSRGIIELTNIEICQYYIGIFAMNFSTQERQFSQKILSVQSQRISHIFLVICLIQLLSLKLQMLLFSGCNNVLVNPGQNPKKRLKSKLPSRQTFGILCEKGNLLFISARYETIENVGNNSLMEFKLHLPTH